MKKTFQIFLLLLSFNAFSQRVEFGPFGGGSYYIGDLNPKKHFLSTLPAYGGLYRYNFNPRFAFKGDVFYGSIEGDDAKSGFNPQRNLSFQSKVLEFSTQFEFNFFPYVTGNLNYPVSPYVFLGIALFHFDPKASYNGQLYELQPLGTEGQGTTAYPNRKPYSLMSFSIPFGVGLKFNLMRGVGMGFEYGLRRTFTDYLDDVSTTYASPDVLSSEKGPISAALADRSTNGVDHTGLQRGNSKNKDWYAFAGIFITFRLKFSHQSCPAYNKKRNYFEYDAK